MSYSVKEIFFSLQGEGAWAGTPMVFLRLSGCNLGCPFCDTDFAGGERLGEKEILERILACGGDCRRVCITGGEPLLQLGEGLIGLLHENGYRIHLETNGTLEAPDGIDWICVSPKEHCCGEAAKVKLSRADELKLVYRGAFDQAEALRWERYPAAERFIQPCDTGEEKSSGSVTSEAVKFVKAHPSWRLSIQVHKYLKIQ